MPSVCRSVAQPPREPSASAAAVALAAVTGTANGEQRFTALGTTAQRQEEDDGHGRIVVFT
jgi:hypothetical protein